MASPHLSFSRDYTDIVFYFYKGEQIIARVVLFDDGNIEIEERLYKKNPIPFVGSRNPELYNQVYDWLFEDQMN